MRIFFVLQPSTYYFLNLKRKNFLNILYYSYFILIFYIIHIPQSELLQLRKREKEVINYYYYIFYVGVIKNIAYLFVSKMITKFIFGIPFRISIWNLLEWSTTVVVVGISMCCMALLVYFPAKLHQSDILQIYRSKLTDMKLY